MAMTEQDLDLYLKMTEKTKRKYLGQEPEQILLDRMAIEALDKYYNDNELSPLNQP